MHKAGAAQAAGDAEVFQEPLPKWFGRYLLILLAMGVASVIFSFFWEQFREIALDVRQFCFTCVGLLALDWLFQKDFGPRVEVTRNKVRLRAGLRRKELRLDQLLYMRGRFLETRSQAIALPPITAKNERLRARIAEWAPIIAEDQAPPHILPLRVHPVREHDAVMRAKGAVPYYGRFLAGFLLSILLFALVWGVTRQLPSDSIRVGFNLAVGVSLVALLAAALLRYTRLYARSITFFKGWITVDRWLKRHLIPAAQVQRVQVEPLPSLLSSKAARAIIVVKQEGRSHSVPLRAPEEEVARTAGFPHGAVPGGRLTLQM